MMNLLRLLPLISCLWAFQPLIVTASPACPVQGLDNKVCPIVVSFFDDVAKQNPDFAKHWQNHHWVGQTGSNFSFQDLKLKINVHDTLSFYERRQTVELEKFINDTLGKAAKTNPGFQQVLDSHNFFVMTVQAMHLALQRGADHFNKGGAPLISLRTQTSESEELELTAEETYQAPTTDKYLNDAGIFFTSNRRYQHAVKIDSTTYKAGIKVAPVVVSVLNQITQAPKAPKTPVPGQQKLVVGAGGGSGQVASSNQQSVNGPVSIQKQPGDRSRQGAPVIPAAPKAPKTPVPGQQKTVVGAGGGSGQVASSNHQSVNGPISIQKQPGDRSRQGAPVIPAAPKAPKTPVPGQQKTVVGAGGGSGQVASSNHQSVNGPISIQKQPGDRSRQGSPVLSQVSKGTKISGSGSGPQKQVFIVKVPSTHMSKPAPSVNQQSVNGPVSIQKQPGDRSRQGAPVLSSVSKGTKGSGPSQQKQVVAAQIPPTHMSKPVPSTNQQSVNGPISIQKQPADRSRQGTPVIPAAPKVHKTPVSGQQKTVVGAGGGSGQVSHGNQQNVNAPVTIQKQPGVRGRQGTPIHQNVLTTVSHNAIRPSKVSIQKAPEGTNKSNVNNILTTQKAGSQTDANERTYLVDENNKVWSCKVSFLGFRVTANSADESISRHGHVETAHVKSAQLAHVPANHAVGSGCLISVHK